MMSSVFESLQESTYFHINFYLQFYSLLSSWQRNILTFESSNITYYVWLQICIFPLSTTFLLSSRIWVYICFKAEPDVLELARSLSLRRNDSNQTLGWMVRTCLRPILIQNFEYTIWYLLNAVVTRIKAAKTWNIRERFKCEIDALIGETSRRVCIKNDLKSHT